MSQTISAILKEMKEKKINYHTMYIDKKNEGWEIQFRRLITHLDLMKGISCLCLPTNQ